MVSVSQGGATAEELASTALRARELTGKPVVLRGDDPGSLRKAAEAISGAHAVLASATPDTVDDLLPVARDHGHALAVTAPDLDQLTALVTQVREAGFNDLLIELPAHSSAEHFQARSIARRLAIKQSYKPLGYPFLRFIDNEEILEGTAEAVGEIAKYGGICVLPHFNLAQVAALITLRLNIYTDPQQPIQVEPKLYPIGEPSPDSPVFLTTNFSLTFFMVSGEIENSGISAWLVVPECEGMSVLTAWAAGKFSGASVAKFCREIGIEDQVTARRIVIPGFVAQMSGELEEKMPGWEVMVGPQEAADLESYIGAKLQPH
jgi:acetyl-CoA decarbonylase/synthase complex subunit gamma